MAKSNKISKRSAPKQGQPASDTRTKLRVGPLKTQNMLVEPKLRLKKAMKKLSRYGK